MGTPGTTETPAGSESSESQTLPAPEGSRQTEVTTPKPCRCHNPLSDTRLQIVEHGVPGLPPPSLCMDTVATVTDAVPRQGETDDFVHSGAAREEI